MDAALEIHDYLPITYPTSSEGDYIRFIWEAFEGNYQSGKYQFALLALHMLYMSYVYFSVWQIKQTKPEAFSHCILFQHKEKELLNASSPFTFSKVNEKSIFKFLRLAGCDNPQIAKFQKLVDQRNDIAHPNGNIFFSDQITANERIEDMIAHIRSIHRHMTPVIHSSLNQFLQASINPDDREFVDANDQVEQLLLHKLYLSRKDIETCLACDLSAFADSPHKGEVNLLMEALKAKGDN